MEKNDTLLYGEILRVNKEHTIDLDDGTNYVVKPGDLSIVGFDGYLHHFSADIAQPLSKDINYSGFSSVGLSQFITMYLDINMNIRDKLAELEIDIDYFADMIRNGLVRIGFTDDLPKENEEDEPEK